MKSVMISTNNKIFSGRLNQDEWDGRGMWHVQGRGEMLTGFWWRNLSDHFENVSLDCRIIFKGTLRKDDHT